MTRKWTFLLPLLCTFIIINFIPLLLSAQGSHSDITGIVRNERGAPLLGVSVLITNSRNEFNAATQTDSTGVFSFSRLPAGSGYNLTFSSIGYEPQTLDGYNLKPDANLSIVIKL